MEEGVEGGGESGESEWRWRELEVESESHLMACPLDTAYSVMATACWRRKSENERGGRSGIDSQLDSVRGGRGGWGVERVRTRERVSVCMRASICERL